MRRIAQQIEVSRLLRIGAAEDYILAATADIQTVQLPQLKRLPIDGNRSEPTHIQNPELAPLKKIISPQVRVRLQLQRLIRRHGSTNHSAVQVHISKLDLSRAEHILQKKC